jgi:3-polyprenyl-4-hydroxybenzoate decarboxylase
MIVALMVGITTASIHSNSVETNSMLMAPTLVYVKAAIVNPFTDN